MNDYNKLEDLRGFTDDFAREFVIPQIDFWLKFVYKVPHDFKDELEQEYYEGVKESVDILRKRFSPPYYSNSMFPMHEVIIPMNQVNQLKGLFGDNYSYLKNKIKQKEKLNSEFLSIKDESDAVEIIELYLTKVAPELKDSLGNNLFKSFSSMVLKENNSETDVKKMYDIFICHASEDKEFTDKLAKSLRDAEIKVWYDDFIIDWGDSIRASIDAGLRESRFGLVVFSNAFIKKKKWTEYELNDLVSRESAKSNIILPILHGITIDDFKEYSLSLADRLAKDSHKDSITEIVMSVKSLL